MLPGNDSLYAYLHLSMHTGPLKLINAPGEAMTLDTLAIDTRSRLVAQWHSLFDLLSLLVTRTCQAQVAYSLCAHNNILLTDMLYVHRVH